MSATSIHKVMNTGSNDNGDGNEVRGEETMQKLETEGVLECPLCLEEFNGMKPIYQCLDGHIVCQKCYMKLPHPRRCATCRAPMPRFPVRNRVVEHIASTASALGLLEEPPPAPETKGTKRAAARQAKSLAQAKRRKVVHIDITCDGPECANNEKDLEGIRYKCMECENFDMCESCAASGFHKHHVLARIANPRLAPIVDKTFMNYQALKARRAQVAPVQTETNVKPMAATEANNETLTSVPFQNLSEAEASPSTSSQSQPKQEPSMVGPPSSFGPTSTLFFGGQRSSVPNGSGSGSLYGGSSSETNQNGVRLPLPMDLSTGSQRRNFSPTFMPRRVVNRPGGLPDYDYEKSLDSLSGESSEASLVVPETTELQELQQRSLMTATTGATSSPNDGNAVLMPRLHEFGTGPIHSSASTSVNSQNASVQNPANASSPGTSSTTAPSTTVSDARPPGSVRRTAFTSEIVNGVPVWWKTVYEANGSVISRTRLN